MAYVFEIKEGGESLFLSERGLSNGYDFEHSYEDFFQYPYVHEGAVPRLPEWTQNAVFYQIFPDRFFRGERSKDDSYINLKWGEKPTAKSFAGGDLKGIKERLPYLSELGVNALYLTPIFLSPSYHKYDIVDYLKIDPQLGSEEDLKDLIAAAHARDIKIVLDAVFNHISAESPLFKDVVEKGKSSPYAGWFYLGKGKPDVEKGNYLYFSCCPYMPKLRTSNPACARYLIDVAIHYLDLGIDGWRLDVAELDFRPRGCFLKEETLHNHEKAYRIVRLVGLGKRTLIELKGLQKGEKLLYKVPNSDLIYVSLIVYMRKREKSR